MANETEPGPRALEFFSVQPRRSPVRGPGEAPFGMLQMEYRSEADREVYESAAPAFLGNIETGFAAFPDCDLNLTVLEFAPGFLLPLHSHKAPCLYYVERGTIIMGNRELGVGEGFLARADQIYGYMAGPNGARVIEFRSGFTLDFALKERNVANWKRRFEKSIG